MNCFLRRRVKMKIRELVETIESAKTLVEFYDNAIEDSREVAEFCDSMDMVAVENDEYSCTVSARVMNDTAKILKKLIEIIQDSYIG
jgi:N-acetylglucosamine kinase-like BadF-type ATPase